MGAARGAGWLVNAPPPQTYDDESDLGEPMQLVADTGDTSADGVDLVVAFARSVSAGATSKRIKLIAS